MKIAALYVETNGCYFGLDNVEPWDREREMLAATPGRIPLSLIPRASVGVDFSAEIPRKILASKWATMADVSRRRLKR